MHFGPAEVAFQLGKAAAQSGTEVLELGSSQFLLLSVLYDCAIDLCGIDRLQLASLNPLGKVLDRLGIGRSGSRPETKPSVLVDSERPAGGSGPLNTTQGFRDLRES